MNRSSDCYSVSSLRVTPVFLYVKIWKSLRGLQNRYRYSDCTAPKSHSCYLYERTNRCFTIERGNILAFEKIKHVSKRIREGALKTMLHQTRWIYGYARQYWLVILFYTLIGLLGTRRFAGFQPGLQRSSLTLSPATRPAPFCPPLLP